jgi:hypothetical protein
MKPISQWTLVAKTWTLRDMLATEIIKKGPSSPDFAHAIYDLIKGRVNDPEVSDEDIRNLTFQELGIVSERIAEKMMEYCRMETALSRMSSMVNAGQKESKPS